MTAETFNGSATFYWITTPGLAACDRSHCHYNCGQVQAESNAE